jgi:Uma2 family endonuclease
MADVATPARATEDDLRAMPEDGRKYELVDGQIVVSPAGYRHGLVSVRLSARLASFAESQGLGDVLDSSTGFRLPGGNVRSPDVAFVRAGRVDVATLPDGYPPLVPDLVVEVLSPEDRPRALLDKVGEYLQAGVRLVWVVDPRSMRAAIYRSLTDVREIDADGFLDGEDVLPMFRCALRDILA